MTLIKYYEKFWEIRHFLRKKQNTTLQLLPRITHVFKMHFNMLLRGLRKSFIPKFNITSAQFRLKPDRYILIQANLAEIVAFTNCLFSNITKY